MQIAPVHVAEISRLQREIPGRAIRETGDRGGHSRADVAIGIRDFVFVKDAPYRRAIARRERHAAQILHLNCKVNLVSVARLRRRDLRLGRAPVPCSP